MSPPSGQSTALAPRPARTGLLARVRKGLGSFFTDVEYRLRVSPPFTYGSGKKRVFYPGCSLPAADPDLVMRAYEWLRARDPEVALWSDCCGMPLEKFSSPEAAARGRERTKRLLRESGTEEIITACGNCAVQFDSLAVPGLRITSLYGLLAEEDWGARAPTEPVVVHHPCSARIDQDQQKHFRALAGRLHLTVVNADDTKHPLSCCLVETPSAMAKRKALSESKMVTYCAHCTMAFQSDIPTRHVLQEIFGKPEERWAPRGRVSRFQQYARFARMAGERLASRTGAAGDAVSAGSGWALRALLGLAALALILVAWRALDLGALLLPLVSWARGAGLAGVIAYAIGYVVSTVLLLPGSVLTLGAGFAWGPVLGVAVVSPVSVLAATASFVLGRTLLRARIERRLGEDPRVAAIDRAVGDNGLKLVLLLRLSPVLPFNLLNYALALTRIRLRDYVIGSAVGMFPATVLFVYLGSLVTSGSELLTGHRPAAGLAGTALTWAGLLATVAVVVQTTRIARAELRKVLVEPPP